jgi:hypothetical protein
MSLPTSLSSGLISDSARGTSRARPDLELRSAVPDLAGPAPVAARASSQCTGPSRFARVSRLEPAWWRYRRRGQRLRRPIRALGVSGTVDVETRAIARAGLSGRRTAGAPRRVGSGDEGPADAPQAVELPTIRTGDQPAEMPELAVIAGGSDQEPPAWASCLLRPWKGRRATSPQDRAVDRRSACQGRARAPRKCTGCAAWSLVRPAGVNLA